MGERGRTALAMLLMPAIVVAVAWCAAALWFDRPFDRLRVPSTVEGHLDPLRTPRPARDFSKAPWGRIGKLLAEPIRCNGMARLVFAFLAILA